MRVLGKLTFGRPNFLPFDDKGQRPRTKRNPNAHNIDMTALKKHQVEYLLKTSISDDDWAEFNKIRAPTLEGMPRRGTDGLSEECATALKIYKKSPKAFHVTRPNNAIAASSLSSSNKKQRSRLEGVGVMPEGCDFDPTEARILDALRPTEKYAGDDNGLYCGETDTLPRGEVGTGGTQEVLLKSLLRLKLRSTVRDEVSLKESNCSAGGLITPNSRMDFVFELNNVVYAIVAEAKKGEIALINAKQRACGQAARIALRHFELGIPRDQIVVPLALYNGSTMSFGATIMLEPTFPAYFPLSKGFDLALEDERKWAIAWILKIDKHAEKMSQMTPIKPKFSPREFWLDENMYFLKYIGIRHEGIFKAVSANGDVYGGIRHMLAALNTLHKDDAARKHVVFPLSLRTREEKDSGASVTPETFVFPRLNGYRIGTPAPFDESGEVSKEFRKFRTALRSVVDVIHKAGVIHCDLYPSNYMWKMSAEGEFDIKIVDWDWSHRLSEKGFMPEMEKAIRFKPTVEEIRFDKDYDIRYLELLDDDNIKRFRAEAEGLNSNETGSVNKSFSALWKKVRPIFGDSDLDESGTEGLEAGTEEPWGSGSSSNS